MRPAVIFLLVVVSGDVGLVVFWLERWKAAWIQGYAQMREAWNPCKCTRDFCATLLKSYEAL